HQSWRPTHAAATRPDRHARPSRRQIRRLGAAPDDTSSAMNATREEPMTHERWVPFTGPARPLPAIAKGEPADQARALWTEVENRRTHAAAVEEARRNAEHAAQAAHQALEAERARAAEAAEVSTLAAQLLAKRDQL